MSITVVISAQVSDFDFWRSKFDGLEDQRIAAGINAKAYRNQDEPNTSYVIGTAPSKEIFIEFFTSPDRQAIQDSGVITSQPEIVFLEECCSIFATYFQQDW